MDDTPFIYRSPRLYQFVMRLLHVGHFEARYTDLAALVPAGASIVEVCAGDARLYTRYLRDSNPAYIGLDNSPQFVEAGRKQGLEFRMFDGKKDAIPTADIVIIQASLHIFIREMDAFLDRLKAAAREKVIIAEPVRNMSSSSNPVVAKLARWLTRPRGGDDYTGFRFDEHSLRSLLEKNHGLEHFALCAGGREAIAVLKGTGGPEVRP
ncbi:MAG: class I SAM-dependent methyltransferase [Verrucomicrobiales bacterium]